jgi:integrase/recombinase XerD
MSVRTEKRKDGTERHVIDYYTDGRKGKRHQYTCPAGTTRYEAEAIERDLKEERDPDLQQVILPDDTIVKNVFPKYLDWYQLHRSPKTLLDITSVYKMHIKTHLGLYRVEDIGKGHFNAYQRIRKTEVIIKHGRKPVDAQGKKRPELNLINNRTINKELAYFSGFLKWCREEAGLNVKVFTYKKLPYKRPIPIILTLEEIARIVSVAPPKYKALYLVLYGPGLRITEALMMKPEDVDYNSWQARVKQKGGTYKLVPLSDLAVECLKAIEPEDKSDYYFKNRRTGTAITDIRRPLERDAKEAGITKKVTPHLFRHSIATHLIGAGTNLRVIQKLLGHSQIGTTEWYTQVDIDNVKAAADNITIKLPASVLHYNKPKYKHGVDKVVATRLNRQAVDIKRK